MSPPRATSRRPLVPVRGFLFFPSYGRNSGKPFPERSRHFLGIKEINRKAKAGAGQGWEVGVLPVWVLPGRLPTQEPVRSWFMESSWPTDKEIPPKLKCSQNHGEQTAKLRASRVEKVTRNCVLFCFWGLGRLVGSDSIVCFRSCMSENPAFRFALWSQTLPLDIHRHK